jgi:hypothetical protein
MRYDNNGVFGFGTGDVPMSRDRRYPLVRVGGKRAQRVTKVNTFARVQLEDAARRDSGHRTIVPTGHSGYSVGDIVTYRGRGWRVAATCYRCHATGWTRLEAQRNPGESGPLPRPLTRECEHAPIVRVVRGEDPQVRRGPRDAYAVCSVCNSQGMLRCPDYAAGTGPHAVEA